MKEWMNEWMNECLPDWLNDGWMDGWMAGWLDGWLDGWMMMMMMMMMVWKRVDVDVGSVGWVWLSFRIAQAVFLNSLCAAICKQVCVRAHLHH